MMLSPKSLGLAGGILKGLAMFVMTLVAVNTGYAAGMLGMVAQMWPGYAVTVGGSVIGFVYGFISGFFWLFLLGWLYNRFVARVEGNSGRDRPREWK